MSMFKVFDGTEYKPAGITLQQNITNITNHIEDVSLDFTVNPDVVSSATVRAHKCGNMVFLDAVVIPVNLTTLQNKIFFFIAEKSRPKEISWGQGTALIIRTDENSATKSFAFRAIPSGSVEGANRGGYVMSITTASEIFLNAFWEVN